MINLLPPNYRKTLKSHRLNTLAKRWLIIIWVSILGLILVLIGGWFYIDKQSSDLKAAIADTNSQLQAQNLTKIQQDSKTLTSNIKTINKVLGSEIRFSDLIQDVGKVMPDGTVLDTLTLGQVNGAIDLSASAKSYQSAAQIAINLSDPQNQLFTKVDIVTISCGSSGSVYPCTGSFKALFNKTAQARYLGTAKDTQQ